MLLAAAVPLEAAPLTVITVSPSSQPHGFINDFPLSELLSPLIIFFDDLINLYNQIPPPLFKLLLFKGTMKRSL